MRRDTRLAIPAATHTCDRLVKTWEDMTVANSERCSGTWVHNVSAVERDLQIDGYQFTGLDECALSRNILDDSYASIHGRLTD